MMSAVPSQTKRLLVTGGRGRLASLIADHFRAPAYLTQLYSRHAAPGFAPLGDITAPTGLDGAAAVLHLAWSSLPSTAEQHPDSAHVHDLPLLEGMLRALATLPPERRPLLVFFSSGGTVYGNAPGRPNLESDPTLPIGHYGQAKVAAEELIKRHAAEHGLAYTILRISNPYGYPVPTNRTQGLIPHALRCAAEARPLALWGDGHARKDFVYYTDFLSAVELVVHLGLTGTFNLASGESHSVREAISLVEKHTGKRIELTCLPAPAWDVHDSRLANDLFVAATGWLPQVSLDEGIRRAAAGYSS